MNYRNLKILYKKEMLDVLRDKKTILTMVVLPIILYPLLFLVGMQVANMILTTQEEKTYKIAYQDVEEEHRKLLNDWISGDEDRLSYVILEEKTEDAKRDLEQEKIDAYLTTKVSDAQVIYEIHYLSAITDSSSVCEMLKKEIETLSKSQSERNVKLAGLDVETILYPMKAVENDCSSRESSVGSILGSIIPFLLITSILMGAMYPAIDATAGEKERGTLETLLTLPINSRELITSKFLSVATIAVISVLINAISMGGVAAYMFATITSLTESTQSLQLGSFVPAIMISLICVMVFALFMSAVVMCICAFAKSFKEANNYITPLTLVVILTGYIGFIPNIELSNATVWIPVANICLLMKNLLVFKYDFALIVVVLFSNVCYAFISVRMLSAIYNSESVLFGESLNDIQLFERRKNIKKGSIPSVMEGLFVVIIALLLMVYLGGIFSLKSPKLGLVVSQLFVGLLPVLAAIYIRADIKKMFCLRLPKWKHLFGGVLLWIGLWIFSLLLSTLLSTLFPESSQSLNAEYMQILDGVPFGVGLCLMALVPAVCEEIMFRGYLYGTFRHRFCASKAIVFVAFLFGCSHMSLIKLLPTMILGIGLAYAVECSESLVVSSVMHFLNNSIAVFSLYYEDRVSFLSETSATPQTILIMGLFAVLFCCMGYFCLRIKKK